ncbi:hypothetical protein TNCV_2361491 [Trichonephila clavipes]|nr:hypothetical protein TNCV_2361491 [Trichonephila clavipes]
MRGPVSWIVVTYFGAPVGWRPRDLVILNLAVVTKTISELGIPSSNFHTTGRTLSLDRFSMHRPPLHFVFSGTRIRTRDALATSSKP